MSRLYVANLGPTMGTDWLTETFGQFSPVTKIYVMNDRKSRSGRLAAFVTLRDPDAIERAVAALHRSPCPDGDAYGLTVKVADEPGARNRDVRPGGDYRSAAPQAAGQQQAGTTPGDPTGDYVRMGGKVWYEAKDTYSGKSYYYTKDGDTTWTVPVEDDIPTPDMLAGDSKAQEKSDHAYEAPIKASPY